MDQQSRVGTGVPSDQCRLQERGSRVMHILFVLRGPRSKAVTSWPPFWKSLGGVIRVRRGDSFYNWRRDDAKVFIADCYYTVHDNLFKSRN